jgi:hypothetical protein
MKRVMSILMMAAVLFSATAVSAQRRHHRRHHRHHHYRHHRRHG